MFCISSRPTLMYAVAVSPLVLTRSAFMLSWICITSLHLSRHSVVASIVSVSCLKGYPDHCSGEGNKLTSGNPSGGRS